MRAIYFIRSLMMTLLYPVVVLGLCLAALFEVFTFNRRNWVDFYAQSWGRLSMGMFGAKVKEVGTNNIPEGSCLFLFNHSSFFDIFALAAARKGLRFGSKIELFKIPLFGLTMIKVGSLPIARGNVEYVQRIYRQAIPNTKKGQQYALSPEGKRNTEQNLLSFKSGPFIFAIEAGIPIVPVVIRGARECLPKGHTLPNTDRWSREVQLTYLPKFETQGFTVETRKVLSDQVRHMMLNELQIGGKPTDPIG